MRRRSDPRWWRLGAAAAVDVVVLWLLVTTWGAIRASHPAYLITLLVLLVASTLVALGALYRRRNDGDVVVGPAAEQGVRVPPRVWIGRLLMVGLAAAVIGGIVYLRPLPADDVAIEAMADGAGVDVVSSTTRIELRPTRGDVTTGLVFYPGAKVDPRAYVHVLRPLAEAGYLVVIVKLPYNIAFFDLDAASSVIGTERREAGVDRWVVAGHSLGGTAAARYAAKERPEVRGLLLWASYPASDVSDMTGVDVVSVSGSRDGLATPDDIAGSRADLPADAEFVVVDGAVHAFFGDYGEQSGDGEPTVDRATAQAQIVDASLRLLDRVAAAD